MDFRERSSYHLGVFVAYLRNIPQIIEGLATVLAGIFAALSKSVLNLYFLV